MHRRISLKCNSASFQQLFFCFVSLTVEYCCRSPQSFCSLHPCSCCSFFSWWICETRPTDFRKKHSSRCAVIGCCQSEIRLGTFKCLISPLRMKIVPSMRSFIQHCCDRADGRSWERLDQTCHQFAGRLRLFPAATLLHFAAKWELTSGWEVTTTPPPLRTPTSTHIRAATLAFAHNHSATRLHTGD